MFVVPMPGMTARYMGLPMIDGNMQRGFSSPAIPAFTTPEPLSIMIAISSPVKRRVLVVVTTVGIAGGGGALVAGVDSTS